MASAATTRPTSFVATKTITVRGEDGKDERLVAGSTYVHDARHFLVTSYPELFKRTDGRPMKPRSRPTRQATRTPARRPLELPPPRLPCPRVVLLSDRAPSLTVQLRERAREAVRDAGFWTRDGNERGGGLFGEAHTANPSEIVVTRACGPGPRSTYSPNWFKSDIDHYLREENGPVRWVGDWHCHPGNSPGRPSEGDLKGWARALQVYGPERGLTHYVGLILTAPYKQDYASELRQDWNHPQLHPWVLRNTFDRWICEPAKVEGW
jgi:hypothetical protein